MQGLELFCVWRLGGGGQTVANGRSKTMGGKKKIGWREGKSRASSGFQGIFCTPGKDVFRWEKKTYMAVPWVIRQIKTCEKSCSALSSKMRGFQKRIAESWSGQGQEHVLKNVLASGKTKDPHRSKSAEFKGGPGYVGSKGTGKPALSTFGT